MPLAPGAAAAALLPAGPAFAIARDVGGVEGLHVAVNVFSPEAEKALFSSPALFPEDAHGFGFGGAGFAGFGACAPGGLHLSGQLDAAAFPAELFAAMNAVRDCSLERAFVTPEQCFALTYPRSPTRAAP
jgi:hypothetical protein